MDWAVEMDGKWWFGGCFSYGFQLFAISDEAEAVL